MSKSAGLTSWDSCDLRVSVLDNNTNAKLTKNCDPLVFLPLLAMDSKPGLSWMISKFSSSNLGP